MKRLLKIIFAIVGVFILIIVAAFAYLNFIYLPQKVKSEGAAYLEQKSKGTIQAKSIQYIPFKGVQLKGITILSKKKEPIVNIDKLYFNVRLWPLITKRMIEFRIDLYPPKIKRPFVFDGIYQVKEQILNLDFKIKHRLFVQSEVLYGELKLRIDKEERTDINCQVTSGDLNAQGNFYIQDRNLYIEKLSATILDSQFDFIGDVQNLSDPSLNIYGNLDINLANLKKINPQYSKLPAKLNMEGRCKGEVFVSSKVNNPQIGLKINAPQIQIEKTKIEDLSIVSKMEDRKVSFSKFYARLYDGEINLQGACNLKSPEFPANLNLNIFNLNLNKIIKDITEKDVFIDGQLFSLGRLDAPLKNPKAVKGELWLSITGAEMLKLPVFAGITDVLRLPQLRKVKFREANGNFAIAQQTIRTSDLQVISNNVVIYFKGYMDFAGNLAFDIEPSFSQDFLLTSPNIGNILGILIDSSTGTFLGKIKLKGNIKNPRYTFKPISAEKLFPGGIEEGLKQLFKKFKMKE